MNQEVEKKLDDTEFNCGCAICVDGLPKRFSPKSEDDYFLTDGRGQLFDTRKVVKRVYETEQSISENDHKEFMKIRAMFNSAVDAMDPKNIDPETNERQAKIFFEAALNQKMSVELLNHEWWDNVEKNYKLPQERAIYYDTVPRQFYTYVYKKEDGSEVELYARDISYQLEIRNIYPSYE